jgi:hypothetical protein
VKIYPPVAGMFVLLSLLTVGCGEIYPTDYTVKDLPIRMGSIRQFDSIEQVYSVIGEPFHVDAFDRNSPYEGGRSGRLAAISLKEVSAISRQNGLLLQLEYSRPAAGSSGHLRYEVDIENGVVTKIIKGIVVD